jgi:hypothetical protein
MSEKKWGSTVLGWFIVQDEPASDVPFSAESDIAVDAPPPPPPSPVVFQKEPPPVVEGKIDFDGVFDAAGVDSEERDRVRKAIDLLRSLPAETDATVKKQIVEASLKAFGVPIDSIIEASVGEVEALEGYIRTRAGETARLVEESEKRIALYEEEVRKLRTVMQDLVGEQKGVIDSCNQKKLEIQQILEFFGQEAVARVVQASARLHDPEITT